MRTRRDRPGRPPRRVGRSGRVSAGSGRVAAVLAYLLAGVCIGLVLVGCRGSGDRAADGGGRTDRGTGPLADFETEPEKAGGPLSIRGAGEVNGVEVRTWTVDPLGGPIARALANYEPGRRADAGPDALTALEARGWRERGFRLVEVPVELVAGLEARVPHVGPVRRIWLGQPTEWTGLVTRRLETDGGALGGRPTPVVATLVVRSWVEPGVRRDPVRVELALAGTPAGESSAGPILMADLLLSHRLDPGTALVIVPSPPDEVWVAEGGDGEERDEDGRGRGRAGRARPAIAEPPIAGPAAPGESEEAGSGRGDPPALSPPPPPEVEVPGDLRGGGAGERSGGRAGSGEFGDGGDPEAAGPALPGEGSEEDAMSLGERLLVRRGLIRSTPPRPAREVLVIVPSSR